jgi:hypothetical protein
MSAIERVALIGKVCLLRAIDLLVSAISSQQLVDSLVSIKHPAKQ